LWRIDPTSEFNELGIKRTEDSVAKATARRAMRRTNKNFISHTYERKEGPKEMRNYIGAYAIHSE
jgi:hypothetical protein